MVKLSAKDELVQASHLLLLIRVVAVIAVITIITITIVTVFSKAAVIASLVKLRGLSAPCYDKNKIGQVKNFGVDKSELTN